MTFRDSEISIQEGKPVYLVRFFRGPATAALKEWTYSTSDQDHSFQGKTYISSPIQLTAFTQSGDAKSETVSFTVPTTAAVCQYLDSFSPSEVMAVHVRKVHAIEDMATGTFTLPPSTAGTSTPATVTGSFTLAAGGLFADPVGEVGYAGGLGSISNQPAGGTLGTLYYLTAGFGDGSTIVTFTTPGLPQGAWDTLMVGGISRSSASATYSTDGTATYWSWPGNVFGFSVGQSYEVAFGSAPTSLLVPDAPLIWVGEIVGIKRATAITRVFEANTVSLTMARGGLRLTWTRMCPHFLYDAQCRIDKNTKAVLAGGSHVVDGVTFYADAVALNPAGWFDGGFIEWLSSPGVLERTGIVSTDIVTGHITVFGTTVGMELGTNFVLYPGCLRTAEVCDQKFHNIENFGGINHLVGKSPFDGINNRVF